MNSQKSENKKKELIDFLKQNIISESEDIQKLAEEVINNYCVITEPEYQYDTTIHNLTMNNGGMGGGSSRKPGNIWLNWRKLLIDGIDSIILAAGVIENSLLIPLAAILIWNKLWSEAKIEIDERHAVVIYAMWKNCDKEYNINQDKILISVNEQLSKYGKPKMKNKELEDILIGLDKMQCIEKKKENKYWLREWVKVTY